MFCDVQRGKFIPLPTRSAASIRSIASVDEEERYLNEGFEEFEDEDEKEEEHSNSLRIDSQKLPESCRNSAERIGTSQENGVSPSFATPTSGRSSTRAVKIQPGSWKLGQRIGQGSFGEVYVGMDTIRGQLIAVKALLLSRVFMYTVAFAFGR